nr:hypothetical protein [uncultured Mediterranean phage uvMED]
MDVTQVQAHVRYVTPEQAAEWLSLNTANRKASKTAVKRWARIMRANEWQLCPDAIAFDFDNVLINGQHRLMAVMSQAQLNLFLSLNNSPA